MEDNWTTIQGTIQASRRRRGHRRRLAIVLFGLVTAGGYLASRVAHWFEAPDPRLQAARETLPPSASCRDVLCNGSWPTLERDVDGPYLEWVQNHKVVYTIDPELQELAQSVFERYKVPYGAFVAIAPKTGRVLALAEYSHIEPELKDFCRRSSYPAASLVKVIAAAAALETGEVTPATEVRFEGNPYRLYPRKISPANSSRENNIATIADALGKSNNVVFGKIGVDVVGADRLERTLEAFGFNRTIPFDFRLQTSRATVPAEPYPLARTAAGFGEVYVSPIHAALIAAAVGNDGLAMQPYVVDHMEDPYGAVVYRAVPTPFGRAVSAGVAAELAAMMEMTVTSGTSAKVFYRYARKLRRNVGVAGKTGSLTGHDPPGKYEWFIGFAPVDAPEVAVASLSVNQGDLWHIKGTYVAQAVMKEFFGM
jgi:cell division protein FtsI/penicillin-binding protein 2